MPAMKPWLLKLQLHTGPYSSNPSVQKEDAFNDNTKSGNNTEILLLSKCQQHKKKRQISNATFENMYELHKRSRMHLAAAADCLA